MGLVMNMWRRTRLYRMLRLGGYVAFNVPWAVTALGALLLIGLVATHLYVLTTQPSLPAYFVGYCAVLFAGCLVSGAAMWFGANPRVPQLGWLLGSAVCGGFVVLYLVTRPLSVSALVAITGRWDVAPGTFAIAFAGGFLAVYMSVLLGINVAYPQRQNWRD